MKKVIDFLKENLDKNASIVVACSGGPDSMCLLDLVTKLKDELNLNIIVAHVNHKLRSESEEEAKMVENYAKENNITFELLEITNYINGNFTEEDARKRRYNFFNEIIKKYQASALLTAHHGDDLIETILMRLTRGSNLSGYIGIKEISQNENYKTLRPLLSVTKDEIINYLKENNVPYRLDKTNEELKHTRNRYRHIVLPFLKKENPKVHEKYLKFSKELIEYDNFVNTYIKDKKFIVDNSIVINKVSSEIDFIKRKCLELLIKDIQKKDYFDVSDEQMNNLMKLYNQSNKTIDLNNNYMGVNSYGKIYIKKKENKVLNEIVLDKDIKLEDYIFYYNSQDGDNSNSCIYLNTSEITLPLKIRGVLPGDKMKIKNLNGSKKISDIFIDSKVPKDKRSTYPIVVDSKNTVLWVPNLKKSQFSKDKSQKYDIIIRCKAR
jgi:bifunctional protein tilS/hprT